MPSKSAGRSGGSKLPSPPPPAPRQRPRPAPKQAAPGGGTRQASMSQRLPDAVPTAPGASIPRPPTEAPLDRRYAPGFDPARVERFANQPVEAFGIELPSWVRGVLPNLQDEWRPVFRPREAAEEA